MKKSKKLRRNSLAFDIFGYSIVTILALMCLIPFLLVLSGSLTDNTTILKEGYSLIPKKWSLTAYEMIFKVPDVILKSYLVSIILTFVGTLSSLFLVSITAYVLHRKDFKYRNCFSFYFFFTTLFSGGLVPWYLLMVNLGMRNNFLAMVIPGLFSVFNIIIMRTFFSTLPDAIGESGKIDGANDFIIYWKLYLPMALPGLATIGLFTALGYWNEWYNAMLFISNSNMYPLQYQLYKVMNSVQMAAKIAQTTGQQMNSVPSESLKLAMVCVTVGPVIFLFPYIQKYFIQGLTIGSVKG